MYIRLIILLIFILIVLITIKFRQYQKYRNASKKWENIIEELTKRK